MSAMHVDHPVAFGATPGETRRGAGAMPALLTALTAVAVATSCAPGEGEGTGQDVRADAGRAARPADSAGVPIVWNAPPDAAAVTVWRVQQPAALEIGAADGAPEYLLHQVLHGRLLSDGTLVLANRGTQELRFYDASGAYLRSSGGEGDGPAEFRALGLAGAFAGDSLMALDTRHRRASVFGPDGTFVRSYPVPEALGRVALGTVGVLDDGSLVLRTSEVSDEEGGAVRSPLAVIVLAPDGESWITVGEFPGSETSVVGQGLRVDRAGNVWVNEFQPPGTPRPGWQVFGPDGVLVARIDVPPDLTVLDVGREHLLGAVRDSLGVERVRLYRLERGG